MNASLNLEYQIWKRTCHPRTISPVSFGRRIQSISYEKGSHVREASLELANAKLANAETQVEDLKLQLDDALGAEDMLEQLTERNLQMSEVS